MSTPRSLFNSGIGPFDQIYVVQAGSTNITLPDESEWIDLPVGEGIKDHIIFTVSVDSTTEFTVYNYTPINSMEVNATDATLYSEQGSGILAQSGGCSLPVVRSTYLIFHDPYQPNALPSGLTSKPMEPRVTSKEPSDRSTYPLSRYDPLSH